MDPTLSVSFYLCQAKFESLYDKVHTRRAACYSILIAITKQKFHSKSSMYFVFSCIVKLATCKRLSTIIFCIEKYTSSHLNTICIILFGPTLPLALPLAPHIRNKKKVDMLEMKVDLP